MTTKRECKLMDEFEHKIIRYKKYENFLLAKAEQSAKETKYFLGLLNDYIFMKKEKN